MSRYIYKENVYTPIGKGRMKHPDTGEWIDSITYKNKNGDIYTREADDFRSKFIKRCDCLNHNKCTDNINTCPIL
jgi:hypothetical protein